MDILTFTDFVFFFNGWRLRFPPQEERWWSACAKRCHKASGTAAASECVVFGGFGSAFALRIGHFSSEWPGTKKIDVQS